MIVCMVLWLHCIIVSERSGVDLCVLRDVSHIAKLRVHWYHEYLETHRTLRYVNGRQRDKYTYRKSAVQKTRLAKRWNMSWLIQPMVVQPCRVSDQLSTTINYRTRLHHHEGS